jgi:uncharacterized Rmd1/YagE family protein
MAPQGAAVAQPLQSSRVHQFFAVAFEENLSLRQLAAAIEGARVAPHELFKPIEPSGGMYIYPFGAMVLHDVPQPRREAELQSLRRLLPRLTAQVVREDYLVREDPSFTTGIVDGNLRVDRFTPERAAVVALTVAQSAAMEYYERIVETLFARTSSIVDRLERKGTVPLRTRPLHRFIGESISTRNEVLSVLHLLDKPDATWEDPAMDRIYDDLRAEFDLIDRYQAMESKLKSIQEALELVLDVARDRRLVLLEAAVVVLILIEVLVSLRELI